MTFRKSYMIPDAIFDVLDHFSAEVEREVVRAVRAYSRYWDIHRTDCGFEVEDISPEARAIFLSVVKDLQECNANYFERCTVNYDNAITGVEKRMTQKRHTARQKAYYERNKEIINKKRRKSAKAGSSDNESTAIMRHKESVVQDTKCKTKASHICTLGQEQQGVAENSAMAHRITGYCNSSLRSELLDYWKEGMGENQDIPNRAVDNFHSLGFCSNPSTGLTGSKAEQTAGTATVCSKAVEAVRGRGEMGSKDSRKTAAGIASSASRNGSDDGLKCKAVSGLRPGLAKMGCAETVRQNEADNGCVEQKKTKWGLPSAPHQPKDGEVIITKNFTIDLDDEFFHPYNRADKFLLQGVQGWLIKNKLGCCIEKKWICRQIYNFAVKQGKRNVLLGVEPDG